MSSYSPGTRVFAVAKMDATAVYLYGYGVYEGQFPHPYIEPLNEQDVRAILKRSGAPDPTAQELAEHIEFINLTFRSNPRIKLDDGHIVWGCECWWGPEGRLPELLEGRPILSASIVEDRKTFGKDPRDTA